MTNLPTDDSLTEQLQAVDWSLAVPKDGAPSLIDALRARRSKRRKVGLGVVTSVGVVVLALVLGVPSLRHSSAPSVSDPSRIPAIALARLHRSGYDIVPPTHSAGITREEALRRACGADSMEECGNPSAYLVDMKDSYRGGLQPRFQTYWVIAWPPRWISMPSCGPVGLAGGSSSCDTYAVSFAWIDPQTGRSVVGWSDLGVSRKNAPPRPTEGSS